MRWMGGRLVCVLLPLLLAACGGGATGGGAGDPYYPLTTHKLRAVAEGDSWTWIGAGDYTKGGQTWVNQRGFLSTRISAPGPDSAAGFRIPYQEERSYRLGSPPDAGTARSETWWESHDPAGSLMLHGKAGLGEMTEEEGSVPTSMILFPGTFYVGDTYVASTGVFQGSGFFSLRYTIDRTEDVTVPLGTFRAFHMERNTTFTDTAAGSMAVGREEMWVVPALGVPVKIKVYTYRYDAGVLGEVIDHTLLLQDTSVPLGG